MTSFPRPATPGDCCVGAATGALAVVAHGEGNGARPDVGPVVLPAPADFARGAGHGEHTTDSDPLMVAAHVLATLVVAVLADAVFAVAEAPSSVLPRAPLHPCSPCLSRRNHDHDLGPGRPVQLAASWLWCCWATGCGGRAARRAGEAWTDRYWLNRRGRGAVGLIGNTWR